tara:strand:+ start:754 stop:1305 length:552 start_codon:yes stop_codon:yes gene_type:complete
MHIGISVQEDGGGAKQNSSNQNSFFNEKCNTLLNMNKSIKTLNLRSKEGILDLKREIASKQNNIYFETRKVENLNEIQYRIRKSSRLPSVPDKGPYKNYLDDTSKSLSTQFLNLSRDALLVIPSKPYANIYQFATRSSDREWLALFRRVVKNVKKGQFISTHGHGVSYLHVRLEDNPKYYEEF